MTSTKYTQLSDTSFEENGFEFQRERPASDRLGSWMKVVKKISFLRWPVAFFLLIVILICQLKLLHNPIDTLKVGGEINKLVPNCEFAQFNYHLAKLRTKLGNFTLILLSLN